MWIQCGSWGRQYKFTIEADSINLLLEECVPGLPTVAWEWGHTCYMYMYIRNHCVICWLYQWVREGRGAKPREEYDCCLISSKLQISVALASLSIYSWRYTPSVYTQCTYMHIWMYMFQTDSQPGPICSHERTCPDRNIPQFATFHNLGVLQRYYSLPYIYIHVHTLYIILEHSHDVCW